MVRGLVLHVVKPRGRPWKRPPARPGPVGLAPPGPVGLAPALASRRAGGPISASCCSSTSMGAPLEALGASCEALDAIPRAGIRSGDLVPPGGWMSSGALAPVASGVSLRRDFDPPPSRRLEPTAVSPGVLSFSAPPSLCLDRARLSSAGDFRSASSFSKSSVRLGSHKSRISVLRHRIPSLAGQGSRVICTHSNSSGGDTYRCAILMLCHLPHHRRCLHGSPNQRRYVAPARLQDCHLASPLAVPWSLAIPISRSAARPNARASPGAIRRSHEAQACAYGPSRRVIWRWSRLMPWYVIPTLEMFDRRSGEISPTLHSVAKDRTAAAYIFHSPTLVHDSAIS